MQLIYARLRECARQIVSAFPPPDFYQGESRAYEFSKRFLKNDPAIKELQGFVADHLEDNFGHGLQHAVKVTIDAGALLFIEGQDAGYGRSMLERRIRVVQCAGLLHDIKRKKKNMPSWERRVPAKYLKIIRLRPMKSTTFVGRFTTTRPLKTISLSPRPKAHWYQIAFTMPINFVGGLIILPTPYGT